MTRMRSILLGAGTSVVLVLTSCGSSSPAGLTGSSSGRGSASSSPTGAGISSVGGSSAGSSPTAAGNPPGTGSIGGGPPAGAGNSSGGGIIRGGPGVVAVKRGTAAASVQETDHLTFVPASVSVKVGDIVDFTNGGILPHNVTFPYAGIGSATMKRGNSYLVRFTSPGTYPYVCTIHFAGMRGTITVR